MVQLMLQPVFLDISPHSSSSNAPAESAITGDELYQMWSIAKKAKSAIAHGYRLENLAWRLWYTSTLRTRFGKSTNAPQDESNLIADTRDCNPQESNLQDSTAQGSSAQGSNTQGSTAQGSTAQGSNAQSSTAQSSNTQGSNTQGSNAQGSNSQGSNHGPTVPLSTNATQSNPETASSDSDQPNYFVRETSNSTFVLPSDRSLLTAAYVSILAEIQDTSIRQRPHFISSKASTSGSRAIPRATATAFSGGPLVSQSGASPPMALRALSPTSFGGRRGSSGVGSAASAASAASATSASLSITSATQSAQQSSASGSRKKKNIDKFLRKYQTRLEDISELHGEGESSDGTAGEERVSRNEKASQDEFRSIIKSMHDDDTSDEHQPDEHFATNISTSSLRVEKHSPDNTGKSNGQSLLSRLLRKGDREQGSPLDINDTALRSNDSTSHPPVPVAAVPEPLHRLPPFLLQSSLGLASGSGNSLLINDQLELMASNRYERFVPAMQRSPSISSNATSPPMKSPLSGGNRTVSRQVSNLDGSDSPGQEAFRADMSDVEMPVVIW